MFADRYRIAHTDRFGVTHQLFIMEKDFGGTVQELTASGDFFSVTYAVDDEREFWKGQIIDTRISAQVEVTSVAVRNFFTGIINEPLGKYRLRYQKDATTQVFATLRNDIVDIEDRNFPISVKFEGSTFIKEKSDRIFLVNPLSIVSALAEFTEFDLPILSLNNIQSTAYDANDDFLDLATIDPLRLQQFPDGQQPLVRLTKFQGLQELLPHGFFLIQRAGAYWIYQLSQIIQNDGQDMRAFSYNSSGVLQAFLPALSIRQEATYDITPQSLRRNYGGIKRATYNYNHGTLDKVLPFPPVFNVGALNTPREFSINVRDVTDGRIYFSGQIRNFLDNDDAGVSRVEFTIQAGQRFWNGTEWVSSSAARFQVNLFSSNPDIVGGDDEHTASFSIVTEPIPDHIDSTDVEISCRLGDTLIVGSEVTSTVYTNLEAVLANEELGESVKYEVVQEGDFPVELELPDKLFGQGPNVISPGAYGNGGSEPVFLQGEASGDARDLGQLVLEEIIATQQKGIQVYKPNAITDLAFGRMIRLQDRWALLLGGTYRVRDGQITDGFLLGGDRILPTFDEVIITPTGGPVRAGSPAGVASSLERNLLTSDGEIRATARLEESVGVDGTLSKRIRTFNDEGKQIMIELAVPAYIVVSGTETITPDRSVIGFVGVNAAEVSLQAGVDGQRCTFYNLTNRKLQLNGVQETDLDFRQASTYIYLVSKQGVPPGWYLESTTGTIL